MDKIQNVIPKLRFAEFKDEWYAQLLGDLFIARNEYPKSDLPLYSLTIEKGVVPKTERYERSFLVLDKANPYKVMHYDDFAYNPMNLRFGAIARYKGQSKIVVSKYYDVFYCTKKTNSKFMEAYLSSYNMLQFYTKMATGSLIEKKRVHFSEFLQFIRVLPSIQEQQKIASFLTAVDDKIQQLTKKKELLEKYKKGVMQKLFSQEIRFKDDDGNQYPDWDLRKLGSVFEQRSEKGFNDMELLSVTMNNGVKKRSEISGKDNSSDNKSNYKKVLKNDIVYNSMRMWQGASGVSDFDGIVSPAYTVLKRNKYQDSFFYGCYFKTTKMIQSFQRNSQGLTSDTWNLKYPQLSTIKIGVPVFLEQQKIADFLSSIDKKIDFVNTQLEKTKEFKKGLLQQMFV